MNIENILKIIKVIILIVAPIVLIIAGYNIIMVKKELDIDIPCQYHEFTGLYCAGCGVTRMLESIYNLEFYQAFRYNPFIFISIPFYIAFYTYQTVFYIKYDRLSVKFDRVLISYIILMIIFGCLRNHYSFSWMQPTIV